MPMKGIFNQKSKKTKNDMNEFEKQILRINALEVHIKNLLKFEKQVRTFMFGMGRGEKKENPWIERKNEVNKKSQIKGQPSIENSEKKQECDLRDKKLDELTGRLNKFEQSVREIILSINTSRINSLSMEEEREREERLLHLVEQRLSEKLAAYIKKEEVMHEKKQRPDSRDKKFDELIGRLNKFEQSVREIILSINTSRTNSLSTEEEGEREERLLHLVEQRLSEKLAAHIKKEEMMHEKVRSLESQILKLMERENHRFNGFSKGREK